MKQRRVEDVVNNAAEVARQCPVDVVVLVYDKLHGKCSEIHTSENLKLGSQYCVAMLGQENEGEVPRS